MSGFDFYLAQQVEEHMNDEPERDCQWCTGKGCGMCMDADVDETAEREDL